MRGDLFKVVMSGSAAADLDRLAIDVAIRIKYKIDNYLAQSPRDIGKPLSHRYKGLYKYRYGDYRIVYEIIESNKTIIINKIRSLLQHI